MSWHIHRLKKASCALSTSVLYVCLSVCLSDSLSDISSPLCVCICVLVTRIIPVDLHVTREAIHIALSIVLNNALFPWWHGAGYVQASEVIVQWISNYTHLIAQDSESYCRDQTDSVSVCMTILDNAVVLIMTFNIIAGDFSRLQTADIEIFRCFIGDEEIQHVATISWFGNV